jgi:hypothetical protein
MYKFKNLYILMRLRLPQLKVMRLRLQHTGSPFKDIAVFFELIVAVFFFSIMIELFLFLHFSYVVWERCNMMDFFKCCHKIVHFISLYIEINLIALTRGRILKKFFILTIIKKQSWCIECK